MSISAFLNSADEAVNDGNEEILDLIVEVYLEGNRVQETDKKPVDVIPIRQ
jgi:hypothetical protein